MVWIELQGEWLPEAAEQAMRVVRDTLKDILRLETDPAHYRVEIAGTAVRRVSVQIDLFPAGSARSRRMAAQQMQERLAQTLGLPVACVSVAVCSPQQEREEMPWKN